MKFHGLETKLKFLTYNEHVRNSTKRYGICDNLCELEQKMT